MYKVQVRPVMAYSTLTLTWMSSAQSHLYLLDKVPAAAAVAEAAAVAAAAVAAAAAAATLSPAGDSSAVAATTMKFAA